MKSAVSKIEFIENRHGGPAPGRYKGNWSGYEVRVPDFALDGEWLFRTSDGLRGRAKCEVVVDDSGRAQVFEGADIRANSVDSLREQVRAAVVADNRFNANAKDGMTPWVDDLLPPENGQGWRAIIRAPDGKTYECPFTIEEGKVALGDKHQEVVRTWSYKALAAKEQQPGSRAAGDLKSQISDLKSEFPALRARVATEIGQGAIMFMPAGDHTITPSAGEGSAEVTVRIDQSTAAVLNASLQRWNEHMAPQRVFIDKEHEGKEATAWPQEFFWSETPVPGVYVRAEFSALGRQLIEGKVIRAFSPSFFTDAALPKKIRAGQFVSVPAGKRGSKENPARVTGLVAPDIGTFTNNPAFRKILPLWAKTAAGA